MLRRGLDYAAATVIFCAIGAAMLLLAAEILSFSSPVAETAAALGAAVWLSPLRRRIPSMAKHRSGLKTRATFGDRPTRISAGVLHAADRDQGSRLGQQDHGSCLGPQSHPGRVAADRTLVTGARAPYCDPRAADDRPALPARCHLEPRVRTGHRPYAPVGASPSPVVWAAAGQRAVAGK